MFSYALDEHMACCLVVTARDVELADERLADEGRYDGHPCFQEVDERCVGAKQL